jgi:hypothetical protein
MTSYEQLGLFYLGKQYDLAAGTRSSEPLLYDSKDLLTHAVCVGMTGSGKTGLGIALIEEAAIDGIPVLAIDPKGDLSNLLLTFPNLAATDFAPWTESEAAAQGQPVDALAAMHAAEWKKGLAEWDQAPDRIARLKAAADFKVYTPGSRAGTPLALLKTLSTPAGENDEDAAARIASTAASLLTLAGVTDLGPHAREQALVSAILSSEAASKADLPWLVQQIQRPSFDRIGVLDLETFYPAKERQDLALRFNSVLAAPGFDVWLAGDPLDVASMLHTPDGRPRVAIVSIAHLGDAERMLVVSMLLNAALEWTRRQSGTSSLRAMIYMDEVFGYLPPVANPPSKLPLLTLLKQARAFGVGIVLATQNPVDLDYKALSNTGTWFLGKLQTERDKARVLDGIEGLSSAALDRATLDKTLSALKKRVFLMHDVHEQHPVVFETRWTLSYLRGPMTREELKRAAAPGPGAADRSDPSPARPEPAAARTAAVEPPSPASRPSTRGGRPVLPAGIREVFLDTGAAPAAEYGPVLYGAARIHYSDTKRGIDHTVAVQATTAIGDGAVAVDWDTAEAADEGPETLKNAPAGSEASYRALPGAALQPKSYAAWTRDFEQWLQRAQALRVFLAPSLGLASTPGESERDFRIRLQQSSREDRDAEVQKLRARYAPKVERLANKVRTAQEAVSREQSQAQQQNLQSVVSIGATVLGALMGRKMVSMSTLGRATTAARGMSRSMKESQDISRASEKLDEAKRELDELQKEVEDAVAELTAKTGDVTIETVELKPKRGSVDVRLVTLAWKGE